MRRALILAALVLTFAACLTHGAAVASEEPPTPAASDKPAFTVTIKDFMFSPRDLQVAAGSRVTWVNKDEEPHTVAEVNQAFRSKALDTDEGFAYQFKSAGTYKFFCTIHPRMTGTITVVAK